MALSVGLRMSQVRSPAIHRTMKRSPFTSQYMVNCKWYPIPIKLILNIPKGWSHCAKPCSVAPRCRRGLILWPSREGCSFQMSPENSLVLSEKKTGDCFIRESRFIITRSLVMSTDDWWRFPNQKLIKNWWLWMEPDTSLILGKNSGLDDSCWVMGEIQQQTIYQIFARAEPTKEPPGYRGNHPNKTFHRSGGNLHL